MLYVSPAHHNKPGDIHTVTARHHYNDTIPHEHMDIESTSIDIRKSPDVQQSIQEFDIERLFYIERLSEANLLTYMYQ